MVVDICPRCGSDQVIGKKFGFGDVTVYERKCNHCDLFEKRRSTDGDFADWIERWYRQVPDAPKAAAAPPDARVASDRIGDVCHAPADDAPRLAYAALVEASRPERAELIRLQVARAEAERGRRARRGAPSPREVELLQAHAIAWAHYVEPYARPFAYDAPYRGWEFERGFIAQMRTDPEIAADPVRRLFELAPIEHLDLTDDGPVRAALTSPNLAQMRSLAFDNLGLGDDDVVALVEAGHLARCEWLDLRNNRIGARGVAALAASPIIRAIPMVLLSSNPCDPAMQFAPDSSGGVANQWMPDDGKQLEARHGRIGWLHLPYDRPDRYHARSVDYED